MDETRCLAHVERCRALQKTLDGLRVLAGIEVDILPDGSLDMASDVLAKLDLVVAAVHSGYELSREAQTERLVRALSNPQVHVWGHPLSRRIPEREPLDVDLDRLLDLCVSRGVALEINGQPQRLDFPDHLVSHAREKGVQFVLSTDSHAVAQFSHMRWAVAQARRGWLTKDDVLNARPVDELLEALRRTRP